MTELNLVDTSPAGAEGQILSPYLFTRQAGYNYGMAGGYLEFGSGAPGSLPFRVDQAGNVTTTGSVQAAGGLSGLLPSGVASGPTDVDNIQALANIAGPVQLAAGTFVIDGPAPVTLSTAGVTINGAGPGATILSIAATFAGAAAVSYAADFCDADNLSIVGASSTVTSNPACNGIEISGGWQHCRTGPGLYFQYINGWAIESVGGGSRANLDTHINAPVIRNCAGGVHLQGVSGSSYAGEHWLTNVQAQQIGVATGASAGLQGIYVQDCSDVIVTAPNIGIASGQLGSAILIAGACSTVLVTAPDVGSNNIASAASAIWVKSTGNGAPSGVTVTGGSAEGGLAAIQVDSGSDITIGLMRGHQAYTDGLQVNGGEVLAIGVTLTANNQSAGTAYDINCSGISSGNLRAIACRTESAVGTATAGDVTNPVSTGSHGYFENCFFLGSGTTASNCFSGTPEIVRSCSGYNPRGAISAPSIGSSPATVNTSQNDVMIIFTAINGMTEFEIAGTMVPLPAAGVPYTVPARQSVIITWATTVPTWQWIAS